MVSEELIIKYVKNECSKEEEFELYNWVQESEENERVFIEMKNLYVKSFMPKNKASLSDYNNFMDNAVKKTNKINLKNIFSFSAAAIIIILLALNLNYNWGFHPKEVLNTIPLASIEQKAINTLYVPKGVKGEIDLPDGSKVWLNSDSKISYSSNFIGNTREVEFSGEGYFKVVKDSLKPMIIRCPQGFRVEVYGTEFNIKSYNDDNIAQATLYSGSIKLVNNVAGKEMVYNMSPSQSVCIKKQNIYKAPIKNKVEDLSAWKEGYLIFDSTPLCEAIATLERWHGVKIIIRNNQIKDLLINAKFETESISQIMELLKFSLGVDYTISDKIIVIK